MNCGRCGTGNPTDAVTCRSCGYALDPSHLTDEERKAYDANKKTADAANKSAAKDAGKTA